jgi:hypothetical protein
MMEDREKVRKRFLIDWDQLFQDGEGNFWGDLCVLDHRNGYRPIIGVVLHAGWSDEARWIAVRFHPPTPIPEGWKPKTVFCRTKREAEKACTVWAKEVKRRNTKLFRF